MHKNHPHRSEILRVNDTLNRPLWSVMIPSFNCAKYLRETLQSVLSQDLGKENMQIEVVDDCSDLDNPESVVNEIGKNRVNFFRQTYNVGTIKNFETCLLRSRGKIIHILHGDDCVCDCFYNVMSKAFEENPEIGAAFCRQIFIDEKSNWLSLSPLEETQRGILPNALERLAKEQRIMTPSIAVRREVYEKVGSFDDRLICSEDWEMWVRIASQYPIWYEPMPLALYRIHNDSNTGRHIRSGEEMKYNCFAIKIFQSYLPEAAADKITNQAKEM
ncbi:MAG TPA: glycosyltransferase, partial [Ignavibacteriaceae bacterium]|nr:glycosyltransferase [Ignavibacteriaceae bacterium]